ncbi:MAG: hypothetical protein JSU04_02550 [Bdellovibrionales bacterium]|nr:hypothetical protein [Bdellovibrionales bacterium]
MQASSVQLIKRIYGFDLLRIATVLAILYFHVWQFSFFEDVITLPPEISGYHNLTDWVGPVFKYGGLFIVALSFFLIGFKAKSHHISRFFILIIGVIGLQILSAEDPADPSTWNWDVYSYLVFSYIFVMLVTKNLYVRLSLMIASIAVLSIPYEVYAPLLKIPDSVQFTGWNILPWLGLPVLFHSLGLLWREKVPGTFLKLQIYEWPIWIALIATFYFLSPDAGAFPAGPGFEAFVFKQKPLLFWLHMSAFTFLMRLSLDPRVNQLLSQAKPVEWVSSLRWNQRLGFCYLLQFVFLPLGPMMMSFWGEHPRAFDWLWLFIFIAVELVARVVLNSKVLFKRIGLM